ncbi:uncharacterized protein LOC125239284 isoform X2 [Leguminivora glycinivorella]|uniref:uncharacterized protein LOC125239284 isoform X1 n=1 Tax=Leguminivora glycinivorella TaxID=1035111 RepID=UPI00200D50A5|nr:uncharacterized protein LOC125239284 isoform X1 [Leguminivora glycinivorella]XP_048002781.1 uncharacterized protein LOC125239284 isoform X2 [Leguminivora glycinivorella]
MTAQKCVVEGCNLEYDVVCSFSFYNVNTGSDSEPIRQEWIEGAMQEESECLWRHVSLQLCGYHFELDAQGLWIDSPMLPELLTLQEQVAPITPTASDKRAAEIIRMEHNYSEEPPKNDPPENVSRLNVRQLVDTLGYLSLKNLQRKQLWVVKVETDKAEASITQAEQVIAKMQDPKQIIEIIPQPQPEAEEPAQNEVSIMEDSTISDNFIYEIAEEQEITMDEVKEIPAETNKEWMVNIIPEENKPKYAYIKHCTSGKKKRHFTAEMNEITLQGDYENYYILPDADPSVGVEITTSYEPDNYIVEEYEHLVLEERPRKRKDTPGESGRKKKKRLSSSMREQVKQIKSEIAEDWVIDNNIVYEQDDEYDEKKGTPRVRRKNKKYLGYDFVT